jgi:stearoyl-CoA desaturase (delta-9 desaturase)
MMNQQHFITFLEHGLINLPWWGYLLFTAVMTHITIICVTIYLHRHQAHRALDLHPIISHFFRFWLWVTTGIVTKEWVAIHRKHHAYADIKGDPHSPQIFGIKKVLSEGYELYREEAKNQETLKKYSAGTPDDWMERNVYTKHDKLGIVSMFIINLVLFGPIGLSIWALQMVFIPITAAGIINGIGHYFGYRNFSCTDKSRNIVPWGILIGGEELHNNHHAFGVSAKLSCKWYEFDYGWMWIQILSAFGLAKVKRTIPVLGTASKAHPDYETLDAIIRNRYNISVLYALVLKHECKSELVKLQANIKNRLSLRKLKNLLAKDEDMLTLEEKGLIIQIKQHSNVLQHAFNLRFELARLWERSTLSRDELLQMLQNWCNRAEESGINALQNFSSSLKRAC